MDKEKQKVYTARISQANRSELVVILFELMLDSIELAQEGFEKDELESAVAELQRAQGFLCEMRDSLDFQYGISTQLNSLYRYVNEQLVQSIVCRKDVKLDSCKQVLGGVMKSFEEVAKQDTSGPVMENSQQVYAGLTYGKGSLNEVAVDSAGQGRDFRV